MKNSLFVGVLFVSMTSVAQEAPPPAAPVPAAPVAAPAPPAGTPAPPAPTPVPTPATATAPAKIDGKLGKVTQIFPDRKRLVLSVEPSIADSEIPFVVNVATGGGEFCEGQVMQTHAGKSLVEFTTCKAFDKIKVDADVYAPAFQPPTDQAAIRTTNVPVAGGSPDAPKDSATAAPVVEEKSGFRFTMSLGYHSGSALRFDNVTYSSTSGSGEGSMEYDVDPALQLSLGAMSSRRHKWGGYFGVTFEEARRVKTAKATLENGGTVTGLFLDPPELRLMIAEANAMYRWDEFYLLFGLNYSVPYLKYSSSTSSISVKGAAGGQLGVGLMLEDHYRLELVSMSMSMEMKETAPTASADYGNGYLGGGMLRFGYCF